MSYEFSKTLIINCLGINKAAIIYIVLLKSKFENNYAK